MVAYLEKLINLFTGDKDEKLGSYSGDTKRRYARKGHEIKKITQPEGEYVVDMDVERGEYKLKFECTSKDGFKVNGIATVPYETKNEILFMKSIPKEGMTKDALEDRLSEELNSELRPVIYSYTKQEVEIKKYNETKKMIVGAISETLNNRGQIVKGNVYIDFKAMPYAYLKTKKEALGKIVGDLYVKNEKLEKENKKARSEKKKAISDLAKEQNKINELKKERSDLNANLERNKLENLALEKEISSKNEVNTELEAKTAAYQEQCNVLETKKEAIDYAIKVQLPIVDEKLRELEKVKEIERQLTEKQEKIKEIEERVKQDFQRAAFLNPSLYNADGNGAEVVKRLTKETVEILASKEGGEA